MKKFLSLIFTTLLVTFVYFNSSTLNLLNSQKIPNIKEDVLVIDTLTVYPDYSLLYTTKQDKHEDTCLCLNINDANLIMKIARQEGGPTLDGQLWSMRTILNRLSNGNFGNSIWEIVSSSGQFDVFIDGTYINADLNAYSHIALALIEGGWDETEGALYWRTEVGSKDSWHERKLQYIKTVEGNRYYK